MATHPNATAYTYLREDGLEARTSYAELLAAVCQFGNALRADGVRRDVLLRVGTEPSDALRRALVEHVRYHLEPIGTPAEIEFVAKLAKTRSGKIMRRVLKAQETGIDLGDVTTLEE